MISFRSRVPSVLMCSFAFGLGAAGSLACSVEATDSSGQSSEFVEDEDLRADSNASPNVSLVRLSDGDSGWFNVDGDEVEVRLLGYNAPERYENDGDDEPGCNGAEAEAALARIIDEASVVELALGERDRYGRTLSDVVVDGASAVETLIGGGYGLALGEGPNRSLMAEAADAGRGMWGPTCGIPQADGLVVGQAEPNPPGRDEENINGEWVEIINDGYEPIDLGGWDIRDDSSSHRFGLAGVLQPGDSMVVRTGNGTSSQGEFFLGSSTPVWSNRGDTVLIIDPAGVVAAWKFLD